MRVNSKEDGSILTSDIQILQCNVAHLYHPENLECPPHVNLSQRPGTNALSPKGDVDERGKNKNGIPNEWGNDIAQKNERNTVVQMW